MQEGSFDFISLLNITQKYWKIILSSTIAALIATSIFNNVVTPKYRSSLNIFIWNSDFFTAIKQVKASKGKDLDSVKIVLMYNSIIQRSLHIGSTLIKNYKKKISSGAIAISVRKELRKQFPNQNIDYTISISHNSKSAIIGITASAASPEIAATAANLTVQTLIYRLNDMMKINYINVITPAKPPSNPYFPCKGFNLLIALFGGIVIGVAIAWGIDFFDRTIKTFEDMQAYKILSLGAIPFVKNHKTDQAILLNAPNQTNGSKQYWHIREAFRLVQSSIKFVNPDNPPKIICTTSILPGEGKTTTTANLAITFNETGSKVLVIDCDFRKPSTHKLFSLKNNNGIVDYLVNQNKYPLSSYIHQVVVGLDVIPCGTIPPNPIQLLHSNKFADIFKKTGEHYDYILVDCPPIANMADTMIIGSLVDGMIVVINPGKTRADYMTHALSQLSDVRQKIIGVIFNKRDSRKSINDTVYYATPKDEQK